ncbi:MAG: hypothetical protein M1600_05485 [Firmicutes bacterium]|nr:hypothetical protein [Bacillota bacterium]
MPHQRALKLRASLYAKAVGYTKGTLNASFNHLSSERQGGLPIMWQQYWIIESPENEAAQAICRRVLDRWAPQSLEGVSVSACRFYAGKDDLAVGNQYWQEFRDIQAVVAESPREDWRQRFAELGQRGLGIPPREGFVVVDEDQPRSPRPKDWAKPHGPRWIVTVDWPGDPPQPSP